MEENILQIKEICYCGETLSYINELRLLEKTEYIYLTHNDASLLELPRDSLQITVYDY